MTVAALPSIASQMLPEVIREFTERYPEIVVQAKDVVAEKLIEAVKKEEVDFGVGTKIRADRELKTLPLLVDRLCAFVPKNHLIGRSSSVTLKDLIALPLILTGKDSSVREILERALKRERIQPKVAYETNISASGFTKGQYCSLAGSYVPFAVTKADRIATYDPRLSLEERYGTQEGYVCEESCGGSGASTFPAQRRRESSCVAGRGEPRP